MPRPALDGQVLAVELGHHGHHVVHGHHLGGAQVQDLAEVGLGDAQDALRQCGAGGRRVSTGCSKMLT